MQVFILLVIFTVNGIEEVREVSEHKTLLACHANKAQYSTNTVIKYQCIKKGQQSMKTLSEQQIIDLFLSGRTIILFNESGTTSCKLGLLTIEQFKDYLSKNDKEGRIL